MVIKVEDDWASTNTKFPAVYQAWCNAIDVGNGEAPHFFNWIKSKYPDIIDIVEINEHDDLAPVTFCYTFRSEQDYLLFLLKQ